MNMPKLCTTALAIVFLAAAAPSLPAFAQAPSGWHGRGHGGWGWGGVGLSLAAGAITDSALTAVRYYPYGYYDYYPAGYPFYDYGFGYGPLYAYYGGPYWGYRLWHRWHHWHHRWYYW
jgi:hypothetical protein